jgi:hypothetical protein
MYSRFWRKIKDREEVILCGVIDSVSAYQKAFS